MQDWIKGSVVASVLLTGCSLLQTDQTETSSQSASLTSIKVPDNLRKPAAPGQFDVPEIATTSTLTDIRSPALVLATAVSSRVEEGDKLSRVWFDRTDYTGDLVPFLHKMLHTQFSEQGIELQQDSSGLTYTTGWIARSEEDGFWFWASEQKQEQSRFSLVIEPRSHGRSASVTVQMLEHQYFTPSGELASNDKQRQEIALLNQIIDRIGKEEVTIATANKSKIPDVAMEPGMDAAGNPALLTPQPIEVTWSQLETLFTALNFTVTDKNRSIYTYYVDYEKPQQGLWSKLWGSESKPVLPVSNGAYQLVLSRVDKQTAISLRDKDGAQLDAETVLSLYEPFAQAARLARIEL